MGQYLISHGGVIQLVYTFFINLEETTYLGLQREMEKGKRTGEK